MASSGDQLHDHHHDDHVNHHHDDNDFNDIDGNHIHNVKFCFDVDNVTQHNVFLHIHIHRVFHIDIDLCISFNDTDCLDIIFSNHGICICIGICTGIGIHGIGIHELSFRIHDSFDVRVIDIIFRIHDIDFVNRNCIDDDFGIHIGVCIHDIIDIIGIAIFDKHIDFDAAFI